MVGRSERAALEASVLAANHEFYRVFSAGDYAAMQSLWAVRAPIACLHPGAPLLSGHAAVLGGWKQILAGAQGWEMVGRDARVHLLFEPVGANAANGNTAFVTCLEANGERPAHLAATNIFIWEDSSWRMVHHHAGPLSSPEPLRASRSMSN
jgi:ketosteroid isomerase-like protein